MEDKRRRSTEEGTSCNTSPDSGIGHGDPPPPSITVMNQKHTHPPPCPSPLKQPRIMSTPVMKSSPNSESPPLEPPGELEVPLRTPSPCSLPPPSPPAPPRQERPVHPHHFKKKFFQRERDQWSTEPWGSESAERHKGKFRPKGKDFNWGGGSPERPEQPM